ncbi:hypothetical protein [Pseudomonas sp. TWR1-1-4]|uniref:hypothetical protein n=1 Tax=Pseudomonas sp. TWR1-1-4 TaxID=2804604 RepID=UPI003CF1AA23
MSPTNVYLLPPVVIPLNVKKQQVNLFLGILWDVFGDTIGAVTCQHGYSGTGDPQVYNYRVRWVSNKFEAVLDFYNHTSQGLKTLELRLFDRETNMPFGTYARKIADAVKFAGDRVRLGGYGAEFDCFARVRILCGSVLSGNYHIDRLGMLLIASSRGYELVYPAKYRKAKSEFNYEIKKDATRYVSALTALSQHLFLVSEVDDVDMISLEDFEDLVESTEFSGKYIDDTALFGLHGAKLGMPSGSDGVANIHEVIMMESKHFRVDGYLCFPARLGELIDHINSDLKFRQASKRFHDALRFRDIHGQYSDGDFGVSYEIVAYVAAVEALLDHSKIESKTNCENCGAATVVEDYKISQRFNDFVNVYGGGSEPMNRKFKELYGHRSKFVHTGMELHASNALRPNRPLILEGKNYITGAPDYYYNIHEWTGFLLRVYFYFTAYQASQVDSGNV